MARSSSSLILLSILAFVFFQTSTKLYVHALSTPRAPPSVDSVAIRGSSSQFLDEHNIVRAMYNVSDLKWSAWLAEKAAHWADKCLFQHSDNSLLSTHYGEIIAAGTGSFTIKASIETFINDKDQYDPSHPTYLRFTQIVWKSTTEVGCAVSQCDSLLGNNTGTATMYVCLYNPPGNVVGQIKDNVLA